MNAATAEPRYGYVFDDVTEEPRARESSVDKLSRSAARLLKRLDSTHAAVPDPGDEPRPNARRKLAERRRALSSARAELHAAEQMALDVERRSAPWVASEAALSAIAARATCERTKAFILGELHTDLLVDGGFKHLVTLQAEALGLPTPERWQPLPTLTELASRGRADIDAAVARLNVAVSAGERLLSE